MKTIRNHISKISFLMGIALLIVSCTQYDDSTVNRDFSAKDVFKSVMFGTGEFASNLSIFDAQQKSIDNIEKPHTPIFL